MSRRPLPQLLVALAFASLAGVAAATTVYQWKDANGVLHSADNPPAGVKFETREVDDRSRGVAPPPKAAAPTESPDCTKARANQVLLKGTGPVSQDLNGDGKPDKTLSPEERASQAKFADAAVASLCVPVAAAAPARR